MRLCRSDSRTRKMNRKELRHEVHLLLNTARFPKISINVIAIKIARAKKGFFSVLLLLLNLAVNNLRWIIESAVSSFFSYIYFIQ